MKSYVVLAYLGGDHSIVYVASWHIFRFMAERECRKRKSESWDSRDMFWIKELGR